MNTFADLPLLPKIKKSLDSLGFTKPTDIQAKVIPLLLDNPKSDIHAQAQTGTGKTLAFGIPLLQIIDPTNKSVQGLIVAPTRELVLQIYENLKEVSRETGINIEPVYGGMPINRQITNIKSGAHIVVGTPGRLNDHLRRKTLSLTNLKVLTLDEADIMLDMGFKQEVDAILNYTPKDRPIWLFSATVLPGIKQLIKTHMKNVQTIRTTEKGMVGSQVKQYFCMVPKNRRTEVTARFIEVDPDFYGIIFCQTKLLTSEVMEQLASKGFRVNCLHGDMKQALRNQVINGFKNKDFTILVATDVAARGIDVSNLTYVINFSVPDEYESYVHRIGRTGRAGKEGRAILLVSPSELYKIKRLERSASTTLQEIPVPTLDTIINAKMGAVSDFIEQAKRPNGKVSPVNKALTEFINSFTEDEIRRSFAIALENTFFKDIIHEDLRVSSDAVSVPKEICIEIGQDTGFTEEEVRSYLHNTCKLAPQEIRKVRVLKEKTFVSMPENRLNECLEIMHKTPITTKRHKAYLVEDVYREKSSRPSRHRGDRFRNEPRRDGGKRRRGSYREGKR